ncbi:MAG: HD domain-containing protein [Candidatus Brockarchaeota archaeon]|nr:HD domain-containing protein [Candidatus Brockarchaeota archaeon]MBO3808687.1 HD domain-containing protein [Candidatus Brockarchaeota archaeon]
MEYVAEVRDPIYRYIHITGVERSLIDTPVFQRLRRIKQLAGAHLTYPGATHTRFLHSLGVMLTASKIFSHLANYYPERVDKDGLQLIRLAGLLHDIGHGPFSHTFEEVLSEKRSMTHEEVASMLIGGTEIADLVSKAGFTAEEVSRLSVGKDSSRSKWVNQIISSYFDADILDYLPRDSFFTGVEYGLVDSERIIDSMLLWEDSLAIDEAALYALESLFIARYMMFKAVYFHRTVRAAVIMLSRAMLLVDDAVGLTGFKDPEEYVSLDDHSVIQRIISMDNATEEARLAKRLITGYLNRSLLKSVFEIMMYHEDPLYHSLISRPSLRGSLENEIAEEAGLAPSLVFLDLPSVPSLPYHPDYSGEKHGGFDVKIIGREDSERMAKSVFDVSPMVQSLKGFMGLARVYTFPEHRERVFKASKRVFGERPYSFKISL